MATFYGKNLDPDDLPNIVLTNRTLRDTVELVWDAIKRVNEPNPHLFTTGGVVTAVIDDLNGRATMGPVKAATFKIVLDNVANFLVSVRFKAFAAAR